MGQQQLLLIVLGVILVGVAVVLGIQYFGAGAEEGAKDELTAHNMIIGSNAQEWFKKPVAMGGGGGTFVGFLAKAWPSLQKKLGTSPNALSYTPSGEGLTSITITALPVTNQGYQFASVKTVVYLDSMVTTIQ